MATARVVALLPPSETKAPGGRAPRWRPDSGGFAALADARSELAGLLTADGALGRLSETARARTLSAAEGLTLPALGRYTGVLYDALDPSSLSHGERRSAGARLAVVSGYAGLLLGRDPVPDYSLPIGTVVPGAGGLAAWWRPRLSPVLDGWLSGAVVWDLLPAAHAAAWSDGSTWRARWRVRVLREAADGSRSVVSHDNKATKGALARHIVRAQPRRPEDLLDWRGPHGAAVDLSSSTVDGTAGMVDIVARATG